MKYYLNLILSIDYVGGHKALPYIYYSANIPHGDVGAGFIPALLAPNHFHAPGVPSLA
jgi:hypothetical protein